ncbi:MAG: hypothetical protein DAHOPDDO_00606 [Ignavibacteriaceae bacterium]|nr:hypothetical protein [Ignavibacteriaceae bacterium]
MVTRQKLELIPNSPVNIELLYDDCVTGDDRYGGKYFLYAVRSNGSEYSFFAPIQVHNELKHLKRGESCTVTKLACQRGKQLITQYAVECKTLKKKNAETIKDESTISDEPISETKPADKYFDIMLSSYRDALLIQEELNGMVDVTRIAITLFIARSKMPYSNGN